MIKYWKEWLCIFSFKWEIYKDNRGEWRGRQRWRNNRKGLMTGEGYHNKEDCIDALRKTNPFVRIDFPNQKKQ